MALKSKKNKVTAKIFSILVVSLGMSWMVDQAFGERSNGGPKLIGPRVMDFESLATKLSKGEVERRKYDYQNMVMAFVQDLQKRHAIPQSDEELKSLIADSIQLVWKKFEFKWTELLLESWAQLAGDKKNVLDCDSSSYLIGDILQQFNVTSHMVQLPDHVILRVTIPGSSIYVETSIYKQIVLYSLKDFQKKVSSCLW